MCVEREGREGKKEGRGKGRGKGERREEKERGKDSSLSYGGQSVVGAYREGLSYH